MIGKFIALILCIGIMVLWAGLFCLLVKIGLLMASVAIYLFKCAAKPIDKARKIIDNK